MKSSEDRQRAYRRRRIQVRLLKAGVVALFLVILFLVSLAVSAASSGYTLDPTPAMLVHYSGFDGVGKAELEFNNSLIEEELNKGYVKYETALWPLIKKYTEDDYKKLAYSMSGTLSSTDNLTNGDDINIKVVYDEDLAKKLKVTVKFVDIPLTVDSLSEGKAISVEDMFRDVSISYNGVSPVITAEVVNNTSDEFLKTVKYEIEAPKEYYENGDVIKVRATYDKELAIGVHYDMRETEYVKQYSVEGLDSYVTSISQFTPEVFKAAVEQGKECFVDANAYGLRIFTEAGLTYTWVGTNDYTFEWSNPRLISSYLEVLKDEYKGDISKQYNYLELVYEIHIAQANGTGCDAEAVVCFDELTIDENGNIDINVESGQLFSASYLDKNIKESLQGWFGDGYELEKFDLSTMNVTQ